MAYKQACLLLAFSSNKHAAYKFNADATTFELKAAGAGDKALVWGETVAHDDEDEEEEEQEDAVQHGEVVSEDAVNGLSIFLKWMHLCNAIGESSPLVLIASVPSMSEKDFFAQKVVGLTHTGEMGGSGWLYCCRTRGGNAEMWKHYFLNVVCETIRVCKNYHNLLVSTVLFNFCLCNVAITFLFLPRMSSTSLLGCSSPATASW